MATYSRTQNGSKATPIGVSLDPLPAEESLAMPSITYATDPSPGDYIPSPRKASDPAASADAAKRYVRQLPDESLYMTNPYDQGVKGYKEARDFIENGAGDAVAFGYMGNVPGWARNALSARQKGNSSQYYGQAVKNDLANTLSNFNKDFNAHQQEFINQMDWDKADFSNRVAIEELANKRREQEIDYIVGLANAGAQIDENPFFAEEQEKKAAFEESMKDSPIRKHFEAITGGKDMNFAERLGSQIKSEAESYVSDPLNFIVPKGLRRYAPW